MPRPASSQPTDGELELLAILWEAGPAELGAVHARLSEQRKVAVTTVATMLNVMLAKRLVTRKKGDRGYVWSAKVTRDAAAQGLLKKLLDRVFDGSAHQLVAHLLEHEQLSAGDRREIVALLEAARKNAAGSRKGGNTDSR